MATRTPNYQLFMNEAKDLVSEIIKDFQPDNMTIIDNNIKNIQDQATSLQNQINSITTTPAPTEQEIQIARNGYATLLESIQNSGINRTTSSPTVNSSGFTFWLNTVTSELFIFKGGTAGSYEWERIDNNKIYELLENAVDTEIILNESNLVQSHTPNFSGGIETKIEGKFIQNLMRNSNVVSNTIVSDDNGTRMGITSGGNILFSSNYSPSEQQLYIQNTHKYFVYIRANEGSFKDFVFFRYTDNSADMIGNQIENVSEYYNIITSTKTDTANLKVTEGQAGNLSKANVIVLDLTEMGWDTMTAKQVKSALGDLNGLEGTLPSKPVINVSGENLFDGRWDIQGAGFEINGSLKEFTMNRIETLGSKNILPNIKFKSNTSYTFSGKTLNNTVGERTVLSIRYTDGSSFSIFEPSDVETAFGYTSATSKTIDFIYASSTAVGASVTVKDFMITEGATAPTEYIPPKHSTFKINNWIGDNEVYENGYVDKSWGRALLSEAWGGNYYSLSADLGDVYRYDLELKENYTGNTETSIVESYFKDFSYLYDHNGDYKHFYLRYENIPNVNRVPIYIPKQEIDSLTGSNLEEKFEEWVEINDDYVYYKKANVEQRTPVKIGLLTTFENELNTFSVSSDTVIPAEVSLKIKENLKSATGQQNNNIQQSMASLEELNNLILTKEYLNYDANNIAQEIQELRMDGSIFSKSELSGVSPVYDRMTQTYYDETGNITRQITFALTYNENNKVIKKEVIS